MNEKCCCFTGHRKIDNDKKEKIRAELKNILTGLIEEGCTCFYAGGALGFDTIAALTVLELKNHIRISGLYLFSLAKVRLRDGI